MIVRELVTRLRYSVDNRGMREYENQLSALHHFALQIGASIASALSGVGIARISDEWKGVNNQLTAILDTQAQVAEAEEEIFRVAQASRAGYEATGELFTSIQRGAHLYNLEAKDSIRLTETINKLMSMGRGGEGASAALIQFTQAISSGELRGEELRSVMEQSAPLMIAIADAMGTTQDKLLKMGEAGELKIGDILRGLLRQSAEVDARFGKMQWTFAQGWTVSRNMLGEFVSDLDRLYGVSNWLIQKIMVSTDRLIASLKGMIQWGQEAFSWLAWQLGGTEQAVKAVQLAMMALAGPAVIAALRGLAGWVWRAFLPFTLMVAAIGAVFLGLDDVWAWVNGHDSLIGTFLGPFDDFQAKINGFFGPLLEQMQPILGTADEIAEAFTELGKTLGSYFAKFGEWAEEVGLVENAFASFEDVARTAISGVISLVGTISENLRDITLAFNAMLNGEFGEAAALLFGAARRSSPLGGIMDGIRNHFASIERAPGWLAAQGGGSSTSVTNNIVNNISTAAGSPAQVASAAERGTSNGLGRSGIPLRSLGSVERAP